MRFFPIFLFLTMIGLPAAASPDADIAAPACTPEGAQRFVARLADRAVPIAERSDWDPQARQAAVLTLFEDAFDLDYVARAMLGGYRQQADDIQLSRYYEAFPAYFAALFGDDIIRMVKSAMQLESARALRREDQFGVISEIVPTNGGDPITISWQIRCDDQGRYRILNFRAEGVSPILIKRDEFAAIAERQGIDGLLGIIETASL